MNTAAYVFRSTVYSIVYLYVCRGISLAASPSWGDFLTGFALTLAALILAAKRGATLARTGDRKVAS